MIGQKLGKTGHEPNPDLHDGFQMTELGPLPEEWRVVRFGQAITRVTRIPKVKQSDYQPIGLVPIIDQGQSFIAGYTDKSPYKDNLPVIVFGDHTRVLKFVDFPFVAGADGTQVLIPDSTLFDPLFVYYALSTIDIPSRGYNRHFSLLRESSLPLPPLPEQRAIAHVLRTVQRAKEATEGVIAALRELKKSLMRHLFTYGPVPVTARERVAMQETEIGPIPAHWRVVRLGEVVERGILLIRNGFPEGRHNATGIGVPHLRPFNITIDGALDLSQIKFVAPPSDDDPHWLHTGDVIFNNTNSEELVGKTALFNCDGRFVLSNHMTLLRILDRNEIDPYWLAPLLHLFWYLGMYRAVCRRHVNQASISLERLKGIRIPFPPFNEQREIARMLQAVDAKIAAEEARRAALEALFKTLLHELMTARRRLPGKFIAQFSKGTGHG